MQASRARKETHFFTEKITVWDTQLEAKVEKTFEELSRQMSLSRQKDMAHHILDTQSNEKIRQEQERQTAALIPTL